MSKPDKAAREQDGFRGFGLGTAILTAQQLKEIHTRLNQAFKRLNDPTMTELLEEFSSRLQMAGINVENQIPLRAFANRSIIAHDATNHNSETLINESQIDLVEQAILDGRQIRLEVPDPNTKRKGGTKKIDAFPLQILFHNIAWYLAYESTEMGANGLLVVTRLDRIRLIKDRVGVLREKNDDIMRKELRHRLELLRKKQLRLERLCSRSGGIFLGDNVKHQRALAEENLSATTIKKLVDEKTLQTVRFRCSARVYGFIRSGNKRYPEEQVHLCGPLPSDDWTVPSPKLKPDPQDTRHPYPVELILPAWTIDSTDFSGWLFGFGDGIKIESPNGLREKHRRYGAGIANLYPPQKQSTGAVSGDAAPEEHTS
ncbi:WYL domain-containing protein [Cyanobium sp. FGCU-52]|nr:WYL domain-containing protein [Cyanobium sp. FGCU52]